LGGGRGERFSELRAHPESPDKSPGGRRLGSLW
jgi:hypothetical protein